MHLTLVRASALCLPVVLMVAACGQVTGLSNDYQFDLVDGDAAADAATDAAADGKAKDGATEAAVDSGNICSPAQTAGALQRMSTYDGTTLCKTCLAGSCCTQVEACTTATECRKLFTCRLACTARNVGERAACFSSCSQSGQAPPDLYTSGIGACSTASCKTQCGF